MIRSLFVCAAITMFGCGSAPITPEASQSLTRTPKQSEAVVVEEKAVPDQVQAQAVEPPKPEVFSRVFPFSLDAPPSVSSAPPSATTTSTGLAFEVLLAGSGKTPVVDDTVTTHYVGWTTDGKRFDDSSKRKPLSFKLDRVIPGWTEVLQLMQEGEQRRVWIPSALAYNNQPGTPQGMLVFDIYLIKVKVAPATPEVPADVAAAPHNAHTTSSGLQTMPLRPGTGSVHPIETSTVTVHYSGWTTDGAMFDSSVTRGRPATFPLNRVIPGWTEGVQMMVVGEKRRFWIPEDLAYKGRLGPQGTLVFDVELLKIEN